MARGFLILQFLLNFSVFVKLLYALLLDIISEPIS